MIFTEGLRGMLTLTPLWSLYTHLGTLVRGETGFASPVGLVLIRKTRGNGQTHLRSLEEVELDGERNPSRQASVQEVSAGRAWARPALLCRNSRVHGLDLSI